MAMGVGSVATLLLHPKCHWKNGRRLFLSLLLLICCSPVILPLLFLSFPFLLCVAASRFRLRSRRAPHGDAAKRGVPEGELEVKSPPLLQRYLEDQMGLVMAGIGSPALD